MKLQQKLIDKGLKFSDTYFEGASYLFSDGKYLNLKDCGESSLRFHGALDKYIINNNLLEESELKNIESKRNPLNKPYYIPFGYERILRYTDNTIALNNGEAFRFDNCFIDLPPKKITNKQYEQLTLYIDDLQYKNKTKRNLDIGLDSQLLSFNLDEDATDDIIKEIKKLYNIEKDN